jgi:hypothetical protein
MPGVTDAMLGSRPGRVPYAVHLNSPEDHKGRLVGDGQCVAFVKVAAKAPDTAHWQAGANVKGLSAIAPGTAIATFVDGKYLSHGTGNHTAIYIGQDAKFIYVWDQWRNRGKVQPVHSRQIAFMDGKGSPSNDGDALYVIE